MKLHLVNCTKARRLSRRPLQAMVDERADALLVVSSPLARVERNFLAELELKHHLPAMFGSRWNVEAGGLMAMRQTSMT